MLEFVKAIALVNMNTKVLDAWEDTILHTIENFFYFFISVYDKTDMHIYHSMIWINELH